MTRFPVVCGPTAGGKSALGVALALELARRGTPGEVVSADAFQIYRGMPIASAAPSETERRGVPHHLIGEVDPRDRFTVHDWLARAKRTIDDIRGRGGVPVVVGGTHLYVKALLEGLFEGPPPDAVLRARLEAMPQAERRAELERVDPEAAARIHPGDGRRTVRALEVYRQTGRPISAAQTQWDDRGGAARPDAVLIGLDWPADAINARINARVRAMMAAGLLEETRRLAEAGLLGEQSGQALGTKQLVAHLRGERTLEEAVERTKIETRRFAKNQRTWLRRLRTTPGSVWLTPADLDDPGTPSRLADRLLG